MKLREFPGALALGLLASLGAHAALFGGDHEMGGAYHAQLLTLAAAALGGLLVAFGALAWTGARHAADGSVLAARLARRLPAILPVIASAALCFALGERLEPAHAPAATAPLIAAILIASVLLHALARWAIETLAHAVVAVTRTGYAGRTPIRLRVPAPVFIVAEPPALRRRYARPPPQANGPRA